MFPRRSPFTLCLFVMLTLFAGLITACTQDDLIANTYRTLRISADTYDGTMRACAELYQQGAIDDSVRDQAIDLGVKFRVAHQAAAMALEAYATAVNASDEAGIAAGKNKVDAAMALLSKALAALTTILGNQA